MTITPEHLCKQIEEFLDADAAVITVTSDRYTTAWAPLASPEGSHLTSEPESLVLTAVETHDGSPDRQTLLLGELQSFGDAPGTLAALAAAAVPVVMLVVASQGETEFAEAEGAHVQSVDDMDDLQTALAAAFISGDTAVIACNLPDTESSS